ncbi:type VI secretion system baseplate subunit TssF [Xanthobacteraceae bacterium A53D]
MSDGFLQRYSEELSALRRRAARFAAAHPKIAGRLRLSGDTADDPHVERIVQSFAFVAARVRQKLDDEFPELTGSLLETLYPHYLAPVPSMFMARLSPNAGLDGVFTVPRHSNVACAPFEDERCRFMSAQAVALAPVELTEAKLTDQPFAAPLAPHLKAASCLRLSLRSRSASAGMGELGLKSLRFHIAAPWREAVMLHELLLNQTLGIALARHADDPAPIFLDRARLTPAGFAEEEGVLPYPDSSFTGYRLLTEFFVLPQKFLSFDIGGLEAWAGKELEIFLYLRQPAGPLERAVSSASFALNTTPLVNLFPQKAEPVVVDGRRVEYTLVPDARRHGTREVYSITDVVLRDRHGQQVPVGPAFHGVGSDTVAWQIRRSFDALDRTSDVSLAFVDRAGTRVPGDLVASVETLCLNRDLPERMPFGGGHPRLEMLDASAVVGGVEALTAPTRVVRFDEDEERRWRLISHLNLNHLSLLGGNGTALKEMLRLYVRPDRRDSNLMIDAIAGLESSAATARIGSGGMVPGTDIRLAFDADRIDRGTAYLFGSVLDRFFGLYTSINSFTRLTVTLTGHDAPVAAFPARLAERPLL